MATYKMSLTSAPAGFIFTTLLFFRNLQMGPIN